MASARIYDAVVRGFASHSANIHTASRRCEASPFPVGWFASLGIITSPTPTGPAQRQSRRFIQTLVNRWAYEAIYGTSAERTQALPGWLTHHNHLRRHGSLSHKPPGARVPQLTTLLGLHI